MNRQMQILFEPGERVCFAKHPQGIRTFDRDDVPTWAVFFAINPILEGETRADRNVSCYRNFLVEFDRPDLGSIAEQVEYVRAMGVPYASLVSSGGKSLHCVIRLETTFRSYEDFKMNARRVILGLKADHSCFNPSRLSRLGGATRDNGNEQTIIDIRSRVSRTDFDRFAARFPNVGIAQERPPAPPPGKKLTPPRYVLDFIHDGILRSGGRTQTLFAVSAAMAECGWSLEEILAALKPRTDALFADGEYGPDKVAVTIRDGVRRVVGG